MCTAVLHCTHLELANVLPSEDLRQLEAVAQLSQGTLYAYRTHTCQQQAAAEGQGAISMLQLCMLSWLEM